MKLRLMSVPTFLLLVIGSTSAAAQSFTDVAIGSQHICALTDSANVECTTASFATRYEAPDNVPQMIDITVGDAHTCGIDLEGQAFCWGDNTSQQGFGPYDQLNIPAIDQPLASIAAGQNHTCAIDINGRVWCWGLNTNQQTQPPGDGWGENGGGFVKVDAGRNFSCGIQTNGDIACWTNDTSRDAGRSRNLEGPYIDLDVTYWNACGLKSDGIIDCWVERFAPPNNGPYTDLVVSPSAICGLNQNQTMDCTFAPDLTDEQSLIPVTTQFTAIESGFTVFRGSRVPFCGLTVSGLIECVEDMGLLPSPPGQAVPTRDLTTIDLSLFAERYSENRIELFWPIADGIMMEIYRNDVLIETTENNASWYDRTEQTQNPAVYKIRPTDRQGNVGLFSSPVSIDINSGDVTYNDGVTNFDIIQPTHTVDSVNVARSGNSHLVQWTGSTPGSDGLKGYQVRINNEVVAFNDGFRHRLETFDSASCNIVSVAAVSDQGDILDYRTIVTNRFSRSGSNCDRRQ